MLGIRFLRPSLIVSFLLIMPTAVSAQAEVSDLQWTSAQTFKFCTEGSCETFRNIELSKDSIALGKTISIVNAQTRVIITNISVRSINYGRQMKIYWLGDHDDKSSKYMTVGGYKM